MRENLQKTNKGPVGAAELYSFQVERRQLEHLRLEEEQTQNQISERAA